MTGTRLSLELMLAAQSTRRWFALFAFVAGCSESGGPNSLVKLHVQPAIEIGATDGRTSVDSLHTTGAGDALVAVVSLGERKLVRRFEQDGMSAVTEFELGSSGVVVDIAGRQDGDTVVTSRSFESDTLVHRFIAADGSVLETINGARIGDFDGVVMTRAVADGVQVWVRTCTLRPTFPHRRCAIMKRDVGLDGTVHAAQVVVPEFGVRGADREREAPLTAGTINDSMGLLVFVTSEEGGRSWVRGQFLDADGLAKGARFDLGIYTPTARDEGLLNEPVAVAVRPDGAALATHDEIVTFGLDGTLIEERQLSDRATGLVATETGYELFLRFEHQSVSPMGAATRHCELPLNGAALPRGDGTPRIAVTQRGAVTAWVRADNIWGDFGAELQVLSLGASCPSDLSINHRWRLPYTHSFAGHAQSAWLPDSGLSVHHGGAIPGPLESTPPQWFTRSFNADGTPSGDSTPRMSITSQAKLQATDSTYWLTESRQISVLNSDATVTHSEALDGGRRFKWTGRRGYSATFSSEAFSLQEVNADLSPIGAAVELASAEPNESVFDFGPDGEGLVLLSTTAGLRVLNVATGEQHAGPEEFAMAAQVCGPGCWFVWSAGEFKRFEWFNGSLIGVTLEGTDFNFAAVAGEYMLALSETRLTLRDRRGEGHLAEIELADPALRPTDVSAVSDTRFAVSYEAERPDGTRATFMRMVDVVPAL